MLVLNLPMHGPEISTLQELTVAVVLEGTHRAGMGSVRIDDVEVAGTAVAHLMALGHRRIAHVGGLIDSFPLPTPHDRLAGYRSRLREVSSTPDGRLDVQGHWTMPGGAAAMETLLALPAPRRPTAVFACSDEMAMGALSALRRHRLEVSEQMSVIGVDDHEMAEIMDLTTVSQPVKAQGRMAAEILLDELTGATPPGGPPEYVVPTTLVVRGSTGPVRAR